LKGVRNHDSSGVSAKLKFLGFTRRLRDVRAAAQTLRDQGIKVAGPYRTPNGTPIFTLADGVVTERELLDLVIAGKLDVAGVAEFTAKVMKRGG